MSEAERVLGELAKRVHNPKPESVLTWAKLKTLTAPYLPKPEPDRLTVAAREICAMFSDGPCEADGWKRGKYDELTESRQIRAIIAREVAAVEPSDAAICQIVSMVRSGTWTFTRVRAALKGEGA